MCCDMRVSTYIYHAVASASFVLRSIKLSSSLFTSFKYIFVCTVRSYAFRKCIQANGLIVLDVLFDVSCFLSEGGVTLFEWNSFATIPTAASVTNESSSSIINTICWNNEGDWCCLPDEDEVVVAFAFAFMSAENSVLSQSGSSSESCLTASGACKQREWMARSCACRERIHVRKR